MKKFPPMIQRSAGSHPKVIPMNGPKIGPRAATLLNWYPHRTYRLTGKYSTPSRYMWAGVAFFASDRHTFRSTHFPYPQYATPYSPIVTTTHRNGVDRMSTTVPPPRSPNRNVEALRDEEWHETPAFVRENADRAHRIAEDLFRDFGDRVRIEVVGLDSPRGVWLGLRHRVGKGFAVIVDGRDVFRDPSE